MIASVTRQQVGHWVLYLEWYLALWEKQEFYIMEILFHSSNKLVNNNSACRGIQSGLQILSCRMRRIQVEKEEKFCSEYFFCSSVQASITLGGACRSCTMQNKTWIHMCCLCATCLSTCLPLKWDYISREFGRGNLLYAASYAEGFRSSYVKPIVQTTQKLVFFLPHFVNRVL